MILSPAARWALRLAMAVGLAFVYVPLLVVVLNSFNASTTFAWPPPGLTTDWWTSALDNQGVRDAVITSVQVAALATVVALVLGTLASVAATRYEFFGRETISLLVILPIALPGIVTGIALQNTFSREIDLGIFSFKVGFGFHSLVIAHATFCVVVAYNNVVARLRRSSPNLLEASADLGASPRQSFRFVTVPLVRSAILAGGILAFALSFDEIVVTTFTAGAGYQTLPQWIFANISRPNNVPLVNVVATAVMAVSIPLAWLAQRLTDGDNAGG